MGGEQGQLALVVVADVDDVVRLGNDAHLSGDPYCSKTPEPRGPEVLLQFFLTTRKNSIKIDLIDSFGCHKLNHKVLIIESHLNKRMASDQPNLAKTVCRFEKRKIG